MSNEFQIELKDVEKHYPMGKEQFIALYNINLSIKKGEFTGIVGPSGSGKSTLLNLIGLLEELKKGKIFLNQKLINPTSAKDRNNIRLNEIGFVFQFHRLLHEFTAIENVAIPQMLTGLNKELSIKRADELLNMMNLKDRMHNKPGQLSGGEQQRVAIARSLSNAPRLLLADEPTGNLDPKTAIEVINHLRLIVNETNLTCLIVTHNIEIASLMDRVLKLQFGTIVE